MKKTLFILLTLVLAASCQSKKPETKTPPAQQEEVIINVNSNAAVSMTIEGMVCAMGCAAVIEKKLNATPGIAKASVDFPSKKALIEFDDAQITPNGIIDVVKEVGDAYSVSSFSLE